MAQQTLEQFLSTANADDTIALTEAQAYTETTYRKIGGNEARQIFSMFGVLDDIENNQANATSAEIITGVPTTVGQLCKAMFATINTNGQFATDPTLQDGQLNRAAADILEVNGVISAVGKAAFFGAAEVENKPFTNTTLEQVKAVRNPPTWKWATNVANLQHIVVNGAINGNSRSGGFRLTAKPAEDFNGTVKIRVWAKREGELNYTPFDTIQINMSGSFTAGVDKPVPYERTSLLKDFKHFKFEYLEPYANALTDLTAEGI